MLYFTGLKLLSPLARLLFRIRISGSENIPAEGAVVLCCNHKSVLDPFLLAMKCKRQIFYMAKKELFEDHGSFFRKILLKLGAFPVARDTGDLSAIRRALRLLKEKNVVGIFPQGKCVYEDVPFRAKEGAAFLAKKTGAMLLPACIRMKGRARLFRKMTVTYGIPFMPCERTQETEEKLEFEINRLLEETN